MFYGWRIVGVTLLTHFVSIGFIFYSYGVFLDGLVGDFSCSRFAVSLGLSITQFVTAALAPFLGRALDRGSIRKIMCMGAALMASGFFAGSQSRELWQFYVALALLLAPGAAMLGGLPGSTLVANWFIRRRGLALGLAAVGISLSGVVMAPVATALVAGIGWRDTFLVYGVLVIVLVVPLVWTIVVDRPEQQGLQPDGDERLPSTATLEAEQPVLPLAPGDQMIDHAGQLEWSARGALRDSNFWAIAVFIALNFFAIGAVLTHIIPHAKDIGLEPTRAAWVLSMMAGLGIVGKVLFGWIVDHTDKRVAGWIASGLQAVGLALVMNARTYPLLLLAAAVFGLGMGGIVTLWGALVGASFGRRAFGRVMGLMSPCMLPLQMLGVPFAGYVSDVSGQYDFAFGAFIAAYVMAMTALVFLRVPKEVRA
jgi:MFS family permease